MRWRRYARIFGEYVVRRWTALKLWPISLLVQHSSSIVGIYQDFITHILYNQATQTMRYKDDISVTLPFYISNATVFTSADSI